MNRQTTWTTVYDGRGVYAETVNLIIHVKDSNIVWIDVQVDCTIAVTQLIHRL